MWQDNILFGQEYDEQRFDRTLHAANLEDDIKVLPGGILTEIGENWFTATQQHSYTTQEFNPTREILR